jgi:serine/threonine-protein kinase
VSLRTVDAATAVLAGEGTAVIAPTEITRAPTSVISRPTPPVAPPPTVRQYQYEPPPPRRPWWPWLLALGLAVAAGVGVYLLWGQIQNQLNANKPVAVPMVTGIYVTNAIAKIEEADLKSDIRRNPSETVPFNVVIDQSPKAGDRVDRGNTVTILVSLGKPKTKVPDVRGRQATDAVATLKDAHLNPRIYYLNSSAEEGTVTGQHPKPGEIVVYDTRVRINVSKGLAPVPVPPVVQLPYETAAERLQAEGFAVARTDVENDAPKGIVVDQEPDGNAFVPPGSRVTLSVSKGPKEVDVPDVVGLDSATARATLRDAGFRVFTSFQTTSDPNEDDLVLGQEPAAGNKALPGSEVTLVVGRFEEPPPPTTTTEETTTAFTTTEPPPTTTFVEPPAPPPPPPPATTVTGPSP